MAGSTCLEGKVIVVTGAGRGIGRDMALLAGREGGKVVVNDLGGAAGGEGNADTGPAHAVVDEIRNAGGTAVANTDSVAEPAGAERIIRTALEVFGRIDSVVNNAGILRDRIFHRMSTVDWDLVIKVHLMGSFYVARAAAGHFREQESGSYIHFTSTSGLIGNFGQTNYGAAKGGIWGLSNVLAIEGRKYNIRVWTLAPGALTRMTSDLPRYIENPGAALGPDGIAPAVLYMVSDLSGDQTGKTLGVSGPRGVREMRIMEKPGWKPPHAGWKAEDIVEHAKEIFFTEEEIKMGARRF